MKSKNIITVLITVRIPFLIIDCSLYLCCLFSGCESESERGVCECPFRYRGKQANLYTQMRQVEQACACLCVKWNIKYECSVRILRRVENNGTLLLEFHHITASFTHIILILGLCIEHSFYSYQFRGNQAHQFLFRISHSNSAI